MIRSEAFLTSPDRCYSCTYGDKLLAPPERDRPMVHGATDEFGWHAVEDKVHVNALHATILHPVGLDHERLTYRYSGRDFRLTDVSGNLIREIVA